MPKLARTAETITRLVARLFVVWVCLAAVSGYYRPELYAWILPHVKIALGVIMFGMGMTLSLVDFLRVLTRPGEVGVGVVAQYLIMPFVAYGVARGLKLPAGLAIGVILVGTCPGGTASNVIAYLGRADVPLSVTMTSVSTALAPVMTPLLTWFLVGTWMKVDMEALFVSVAQIVLIPVALGVVVNALFPKTVRKGVKVLPLLSVAVIALLVGAIVGKQRESLHSAGLTIFLAVALHNGIGLTLGYMVARFFHFGVAQRRAVSVEVGMQNSGLAVALAMAHFTGTPGAALAGAIYSIWHNVTGPILAGVWNWRDGDTPE